MAVLCLGGYIWTVYESNTESPFTDQYAGRPLAGAACFLGGRSDLGPRKSRPSHYGLLVPAARLVFSVFLHRALCGWVFTKVSGQAL